MTSKNSNETSRKKKKKSLPFKIFLFWIFIYTPSTLLIDVLTDSREMYSLVKIIYFSIGVAYVVKNHNKDIVIEKSLEKDANEKNNENLKQKQTLEYNASHNKVSKKDKISKNDKYALLILILFLIFTYINVK